MDRGTNFSPTPGSKRRKVYQEVREKDSLEGRARGRASSKRPEPDTREVGHCFAKNTPRKTVIARRLGARNFLTLGKGERNQYVPDERHYPNSSVDPVKKKGGGGTHCI